MHYNNTEHIIYILLMAEKMEGTKVFSVTNRIIIIVKRVGDIIERIAGC